MKFITQLGPPDELVFVKKQLTNQNCRVVFICCDSSSPLAPSSPLSMLHPAQKPRRLHFMECSAGLLAISLGSGWGLQWKAS